MLYSRNDKTLLVYGLPAGETREYMAVLLCSICKTQEDVDKIIRVASRDGFHSFRVIEYRDEPPDFTKAVRGVRQKRKTKRR